MAKDFTLSLESFGGLKLSTDNTEDLALGDGAEMVNFRITDARKLKRRDGYFRVFAAPVALRGMFCGTVGGKETYLALCGKHLYASGVGFDRLEMLETEVTGEGQAFFFPYHAKLYLLTGENIYCYDGTGLSEIEPYIPVVMICTPPDGSGTVYEDVNLLTRKVRQRLSPDGYGTSFPAAVENVEMIDWVKLYGTVQREDSYWFDIDTHTFEFVGAPRPGVDSIEIQYEISAEDVSDRIKKCRFATAFGGASDTRVFLYGNPDSPAVRYHSGIVEGKPSFAYFPETAFSLVGTGEPITAICRHYDRQLIFTTGNAYYSYLEYMTGSEGRLIAGFPVLPMNDERGCVAFGQAILVKNTPVTIAEDGLFQWISTNIRDERNAEHLSDPIDQALQKEKLEEAVLFNRKEKSELYVCVGENLYVYNYRLKLFYRYKVPPIFGFCQGDRLYFYNEEGIFAVGGNTDDGQRIHGIWKSKLLDFSNKTRGKKLFGTTMIAKGGAGSELQISFRNENDTENLTKRVRFSGKNEGERIELHTPKRRFGAMEITIETDSEESVHVLSLHFRGRITDAE